MTTLLIAIIRVTGFAQNIDGDGQMISLANGSGTNYYAYDAAGRRASRTSGGTTTGFVYDGSRIVNEEQSGSVTATYTYGNALIGQGTNVNLYDGQGSSRQTSGSGGTVTTTQVYDGFGNTVAASGTPPTYGYCGTSGYRDDGDAGLTHVGARYYDASVGRFITRDTDLTQKPYTYCEGDPIDCVDPSGHAVPLWVWFMLGGGGIGVVVGEAGVGIYHYYEFKKAIKIVKKTMYKPSRAGEGNEDIMAQYYNGSIASK